MDEAWIKAQKALDKLVNSEPQLFCELMDVDRYGRLVMRCYAGSIDIAGALVQAGLALAYRKYSSAYVKDEEIAKNNNSSTMVNDTPNGSSSATTNQASPQ